MQDRGKKYWFFSNMAPCWSWGHIHFHHSEIVGKQRSVALVFASLHDNKDYPSERRSGRWWEANLCSLKSFMKCHPGFTLCLSVCPSLCLSITSALIALSSLRQAPPLFLSIQQCSVVVRFKFSHQLGKPLIALLNKALKPRLLPWSHPAATNHCRLSLDEWSFNTSLISLMYLHSLLTVLQLSDQAASFIPHSSW